MFSDFVHPWELPHIMCLLELEAFNFDIVTVLNTQYSIFGEGTNKHKHCHTWRMYYYNITQHYCIQVSKKLPSLVCKDAWFSYQFQPNHLSGKMCIFIHIHHSINVIMKGPSVCAILQHWTYRLHVFMKPSVHEWAACQSRHLTCLMFKCHTMENLFRGKILQTEHWKVRTLQKGPAVGEHKKRDPWLVRVLGSWGGGHRDEIMPC